MIKLPTNQMREKLIIQKRTEGSQDNNAKEVDEIQSVLERLYQKTMTKNQTKNNMYFEC